MLADHQDAFDRTKVHLVRGIKYIGQEGREKADQGLLEYFFSFGYAHEGDFTVVVFWRNQQMLTLPCYDVASTFIVGFASCCTSTLNAPFSPVCQIGMEVLRNQTPAVPLLFVMQSR